MHKVSNSEFEVNAGSALLCMLQVCINSCLK